MRFSLKDSVGTWYFDAMADDYDGRLTNVREASVRLQRNAKVLLDARTEPIDRGSSLLGRCHVSKLTTKLVYADLLDGLARVDLPATVGCRPRPPRVSWGR